MDNIIMFVIGFIISFIVTYLVTFIKKIEIRRIYFYY